MKGHFIDGKWVVGDRSRANTNPSDLDDCIGSYAEGGAPEIEQAVSAAVSSAAVWGRSNPQVRFDVLDAIGTELLGRKKELGTLLAREEGKTLPEAVGEVARAGQVFKYFAGEALRGDGFLVDSVRSQIEVQVSREPIGVVGLITPWNFPMAIPAWKVAPALAFGNAVVLKPAEWTPGSAWALADIISRSGLPRGVFNLVMGPGDPAGKALVNHPHVDAVSFTGSASVGGQLAVQCARRLARVQLEMGGKNPLVVLDDAPLQQAIDVAVNGAFFSTGQRCTASSRLIVTDGIYEAFVAGLKDRMFALKVGHALEEGTQIGPVVSASQLEKIEAYVRLGEEEGATLVTGGQRSKGPTRGHYCSPVLFTEIQSEMRINREEIFGPVASVQRVRDYQEALAVANDTSFGLSAGICTASLEKAHHFKRHAQAGMVMINLPTAGVDYHVPFGGTKGSSYGTREQGRLAVDFYTKVKTTYLESGGW